MRTRRKVLVAAIWLGVLLIPAPALAHPLGNFTINTGAAIVARTDEVVVDYGVDMAEIPAFQERARIDRDGDGGVSAEEASAYRAGACVRLRGGLSLRVDGRAAQLTVRSSSLDFPAGQAGLPTLRLTCSLTTRVSPAAHDLRFEDANYGGRIGWHEVTAVGDGTTLTRSDVPAESPSDHLRAYPTDVLPSNVRTASVAFRPGGPSLTTRPTGGATGTTSGGILLGLVARTDLSRTMLALMVLVAVAVGAVHALGPGHGKALIGASLVGSHGTLRQAVAIGVAVSVMHTASVLGLGLLVLSAERAFAPDRIYPLLGLASGLVALGLGATLLVSRVHELIERRRHGHGHPHPHRPLSRRGLMALAFSGGILPSPSALVVLLGSISVGRTALGLVLIAAFSAGLAASLIGVGVLAIRADRFAGGRVPARWIRVVPVISAGCVTAVGVLLTARGLLQL